MEKFQHLNQGLETLFETKRRRRSIKIYYKIFIAKLYNLPEIIFLALPTPQETSCLDLSYVLQSLFRHYPN